MASHAASRRRGEHPVCLPGFAHDRNSPPLPSLASLSPSHPVAAVVRAWSVGCVSRPRGAGVASPPPRESLGARVALRPWRVARQKSSVCTRLPSVGAAKGVRPPYAVSVFWFLFRFVGFPPPPPPESSPIVGKRVCVCASSTGTFFSSVSCADSVPRARVVCVRVSWRHNKKALPLQRHPWSGKRFWSARALATTASPLPRISHTPGHHPPPHVTRKKIPRESPFWRAFSNASFRARSLALSPPLSVFFSRSLPDFHATR